MTLTSTSSVDAQTAAPSPEVVHSHVRATDPAGALEAQAPMQDAPVIKDDGLAGDQLDGDEELGALEHAGPLARGGVPVLHGRVVGERGRRGRQAVEVVPADLHQCAGARGGDVGRLRRVAEDRVPLERGGGVEERALGGAEGGGGDRVRRQGLVVLREVRVQVRCGREAVDERRFASSAGL